MTKKEIEKKELRRILNNLIFDHSGSYITGRECNICGKNFKRVLVYSEYHYYCFNCVKDFIKNDFGKQGDNND